MSRSDQDIVADADTVLSRMNMVKALLFADHDEQTVLALVDSVLAVLTGNKGSDSIIAVSMVLATIASKSPSPDLAILTVASLARGYGTHEETSH